MDQAGEIVREYVEDLFDWSNYGDDIPTGLLTMREDIGSMWRVSWREIGGAFLSDVIEQDA